MQPAFPCGVCLPSRSAFPGNTMHAWFNRISTPQIQNGRFRKISYSESLKTYLYIFNYIYMIYIYSYHIPQICSMLKIIRLHGQQTDHQDCTSEEDAPAVKASRVGKKHGTKWRNFLLAMLSHAPFLCGYGSIPINTIFRG